MSDILSAMREFRALDDKRRSQGLLGEESERWNTLRELLKGDLRNAEPRQKPASPPPAHVELAEAFLSTVQVAPPAGVKGESAAAPARREAEGGAAGASGAGGAAAGPTASGAASALAGPDASAAGAVVAAPEASVASGGAAAEVAAPGASAGGGAAAAVSSDAPVAGDAPADATAARVNAEGTTSETGGAGASAAVAGGSDGGAQAGAAAAAPAVVAADGGYVWHAASGLYWHAGARLWYEPNSGTWYDVDGKVIDPEVARTRVAAALQQAHPADGVTAQEAIPLDEVEEPAAGVEDAAAELSFALDGAPDESPALASGAELLHLAGEAAAAEDDREVIDLEEEAAVDDAVEADGSIDLAPPAAFLAQAAAAADAGTAPAAGAQDGIELAPAADFLADAAAAANEPTAVELAPPAAFLADAAAADRSGSDRAPADAFATDAGTAAESAAVDLAPAAEFLADAAAAANEPSAASAFLAGPAADPGGIELAPAADFLADAAAAAGGPTAVELAPAAGFLADAAAAAGEPTAVELDPATDFRAGAAAAERGGSERALAAEEPAAASLVEDLGTIDFGRPVAPHAAEAPALLDDEGAFELSPASEFDELDPELGGAIDVSFEPTPGPALAVEEEAVPSAGPAFDAGASDAAALPGPSFDAAEPAPGPTFEAETDPWADTLRPSTPGPAPVGGGWEFVVAPMTPGPASPSIDLWASAAAQEEAPRTPSPAELLPFESSRVPAIEETGVEAAIEAGFDGWGDPGDEIEATAVEAKGVALPWETSESETVEPLADAVPFGEAEDEEADAFTSGPALSLDGRIVDAGAEELTEEELPVVEEALDVEEAAPAPPAFPAAAPASAAPADSAFASAPPASAAPAPSAIAPAAPASAAPAPSAIAAAAPASAAPAPSAIAPAAPASPASATVAPAIAAAAAAAPAPAAPAAAATAAPAATAPATAATAANASLSPAAPATAATVAPAASAPAPAAQPVPISLPLDTPAAPAALVEEAIVLEDDDTLPAGPAPWLPPEPAEPPAAPVAPPAHAAAPAPAPVALRGLVTGEHRVVIHTREGVVKRGQIANVDLSARSFFFQNQDGKREEVPTATLKAVFLMRSAHEPAPQPAGQAVKLTLIDGRPLQGWASDLANPVGFFLVPSDTRGLASRVFVYRAAVREVHLG